VPLPVAVAPTAIEGGQPTVEVCPIIGDSEVTLDGPSFILAKRKQDDCAGVSGRKN